MRHSSEALQAEQGESKSKVEDWYTEIERALEHNSPDRLLTVVRNVIAKHDDTLTKEERDFLSRIAEHAQSGVKEREGLRHQPGSKWR